MCLRLFHDGKTEGKDGGGCYFGYCHFKVSFLIAPATLDKTHPVIIQLIGGSHAVFKPLSCFAY